MELHHVATEADWDMASRTGQYSPPALHRDGFLHCCTAEQLDFVLARHFVGVTDLLVLTFDPDEVPARLCWVNSEPDQAPFPHLYGPIPCSAVRRAARPDAIARTRISS
ncbi:DUF952 domain-containing protein [Rhodopila sp.]|uniref:DUF952 domain-containing protein n=1 Tax=Rhodopila sp. TaxID=2480087 RepID=UPI003D0A168F